MTEAPKNLSDKDHALWRDAVAVLDRNRVQGRPVDYSGTQELLRKGREKNAPYVVYSHKKA